MRVFSLKFSLLAPVAFLFCVTAFPASALAQTELIINGSFELTGPGLINSDPIAGGYWAIPNGSTAVPPWNVQGSFGAWSPTITYPWLINDLWTSSENVLQDGNNYVNILTGFHVELSQTFNVTAGIPHTVSWFARARSSATYNNQARVMLTSGAATGPTSLATSGLSLVSWSQFSFTFTPDMTTTATLYFDDLGGHTFLDSVSVIAVGAPDSDGDGVNDNDDLCPLTDAGATVDVSGCSDAQSDGDGDGICNSGAPGTGPSGCTGADNCPEIANTLQEDNDTDGSGDACDSDDDGDGVPDGTDNCPLTLGSNADQTDTDIDGAGDLCDDDLDGDGVNNDIDICPNDPDMDQTNTDGLPDGGDACDADDDEDGVLDINDNCDIDENPLQEDLDSDSIGDACDADLDGDGANNDVDNCPIMLGGNADQTDTDMDGAGDVCDTDDDADGVLDDEDNCPLADNFDQADADSDGVGDACNDANDSDGDNWSDTLDNCPNVANGSQDDLDGNGEGDACDTDVDGDGVANGADNCAGTSLGETTDANGCTIAQLCPCDGPKGMTTLWKNHGKYVSCVAHAANDFRDAGLISDAEHGDIVSEAGQSNCGHKN